MRWSLRFWARTKKETSYTVGELSKSKMVLTVRVERLRQTLIDVAERELKGESDGT